MRRRRAITLQPRDLVAHALTGEFATDGTHAAATLVFDYPTPLAAAEFVRDVRGCLRPGGALLLGADSRVSLRASRWGYGDQIAEMCEAWGARDRERHRVRRTRLL